MTPTLDREACEVAIRHGSKSFHAASRLLPARVRDPALALYAFCRLADDAVDLVEDKAKAVRRLQERLDAAYAGRPVDNPADRAFAQMAADFEMPRALPDALIEGFAWDAAGRRYDTISDLRAYAARVAATVGAMMTVLMGVRDADALARACDLGVAMQLTNIARDVGEDARAGRLYLPRDWMREAGLEPEDFLAAPQPSRPLGQVIHRLLWEAQQLYWRAEAGISALPADCRPAIFAARFIYAAIGQDVRRADYDSVTRRAHTGTARKLALLARAVSASAVTTVMPRSAVLHAPPLPETAFLVAAARRAPQDRFGFPAIERRLAGVADILIEVETRRRAQAVTEPQRLDFPPAALT